MGQMINVQTLFRLSLCDCKQCFVSLGCTSAQMCYWFNANRQTDRRLHPYIHASKGIKCNFVNWLNVGTSCVTFACLPSRRSCMRRVWCGWRTAVCLQICWRSELSSQSLRWSQSFRRSPACTLLSLSVLCFSWGGILLGLFQYWHFSVLVSLYLTLC